MTVPAHLTFLSVVVLFKMYDWRPMRTISTRLVELDTRDKQRSEVVLSFNVQIQVQGKFPPDDPRNVGRDKWICCLGEVRLILIPGFKRHSALVYY